MSEEYVKLIADLDSVLATIRVLWIEAKTPVETEKWRLRLDQLLDDRLRMMRARDATTTFAAPAATGATRP